MMTLHGDSQEVTEEDVQCRLLEYIKCLSICSECLLRCCIFSGKMYTGNRIDSSFSTKQISGWSVSEYSLESNLFSMSRKFRS